MKPEKRLKDWAEEDEDAWEFVDPIDKSVEDVLFLINKKLDESLYIHKHRIKYAAWRSWAKIEAEYRKIEEDVIDLQYWHYSDI